MAYIPPNSNGQATSANSAPVVIASDQSTVPVSLASVPSHAVTNAGTFATQATLAAETTKVIGVTRTADGSGNLLTSTTNALDVNIKSGNPTSITANAGTNLNTSALALDATLTGGTARTKITDGTSNAAVKAASTAAVATDPAVVVAISPNNTVPVSLASVPSHAVTNAGTFAVQATLQANTGVDIGKLTANQSVNVSQINAVTPLMGNGVTGTGSQRVTIASDNTAFSVNATLAAGSALAGKVGIDQTTPGTTNAVVDTATTAGGLLIVTGSVGATATAIKASAGQLYGYHLFNTTAATAYVQIFNVAAGSVTLGTTAPTFSIGIPASGGVTVNFDKGIAFGTAISFACTTTRTGSSGATCDVNFFYK